MTNCLDLQEIIRVEARKELARKSFWQYCKTLHPTFFKDSRPHLKEICDTLQGIYEGTILKPDGKPYRKLMINIPPRFGKSFTLTNFTEWALGKDNRNKIITVCYNDTLSGRFSKKVRDSIEATKLDDRYIFSDIFPTTKIKRGDASAQVWSLEGQHFNYLGAGFGGTITGIGCNIGIIDDPIKNREEAYNDRVLENHYSFYTDTFLSRLEAGAIQIVNMTRWANKDLCGRLLESEPDEWYVLRMEAQKDNGEMLCPELLPLDEYLEKKKITSSQIFQANFHQRPIDIEGNLYKSFKTYKELPLGMVRNYTDTADTGEDYLCSISYVEHQKKAYVTDILYTQDGMEVTEPATALLFERSRVKHARIESNNGGRGFARNVERTCKENKYFGAVITSFHQSKNKEARIYSNSHWVMENIFFPEDWHIRWPLFHKHITNYKKEGKNLVDDCADALTGVAEASQMKSQYL